MDAGTHHMPTYMLDIGVNVERNDQSYPKNVLYSFFLCVLCSVQFMQTCRLIILVHRLLHTTPLITNQQYKLLHVLLSL